MGGGWRGAFENRTFPLPKNLNNQNNKKSAKKYQKVKSNEKTKEKTVNRQSHQNKVDLFQFCFISELTLCCNQAEWYLESEEVSREWRRDARRLTINNNVVIDAVPPPSSLPSSQGDQALLQDLRSSRRDNQSSIYKDANKCVRSEKDASRITNGKTISIMKYHRGKYISG